MKRGKSEVNLNQLLHDLPESTQEVISGGFWCSVCGCHHNPKPKPKPTTGGGGGGGDIVIWDIVDSI